MLRNAVFKGIFELNKYKGMIPSLLSFVDAWKQVILVSPDLTLFQACTGVIKYDPLIKNSMAQTYFVKPALLQREDDPALSDFKSARILSPKHPDLHPAREAILMSRSAAFTLGILGLDRYKGIPSLLSFMYQWRHVILVSPDLTVREACKGVIKVEVEQAKLALLISRVGDAKYFFTSAIDVFQTTQDLLEHDPLIKESMAETYVKRGLLQHEDDAAYSDFENARILSPKHPDLHRAREAILMRKKELTVSEEEPSPFRGCD
jgi:hypothetical protein